MIYIGMIGFILLILYHLFTPFIKRYRVQKKRAYEESEKGKYDQLIKCVKQRDVSDIYHSSYDWISVLNTEFKIATFKDIYVVYPEFKEELLYFESALLHKEAIDVGKYLQTLAALRKIFLNTDKKDTHSLKHKLNP